MTDGPFTDTLPTEDFTLSLPDGRQLAWAEYGTADGSAVIYFHGAPGSRRECLPTTTLAAVLGLRIIVPDRPGYGGSSPRPGRSVADFADDVAALLDHLELKQAGAAGFSGGGPHALACALRLPDRIDRLGLVSSLAPFSDATTQGMPESLQGFWQLAATDADAFRATLNDGLKATGGPYELLLAGAPPEDQAIFSNGMTEAYADSLTEGIRPGLEGMVSDGQALTADWGFTLKAPHCPTHLWHGTQDLNAPIGMGRWLAGHLGGATLTEWPGMGHFALLQQWDQILDAFAEPTTP
ncbi:alpha/beta fold hydrolase [Natronospira bacteriovora]|uniref:Alpha/beta hydrolase n=1 Tax=Natronospira bacteriovora TaxID=3069753 RepID=A0ABU0W4E2_9GAMM|nr:alpha/beta hydrolase [Natronospira sp. AB-CW4]MDQ2068623.1 alpha/beta hydrolase [Natronospira sp. AB-CW4]